MTACERCRSPAFQTPSELLRAYIRQAAAWLPTSPVALTAHLGQERSPSVSRRVNLCRQPTRGTLPGEGGGCTRRAPCTAASNAAAACDACRDRRGVVLPEPVLAWGVRSGVPAPALAPVEGAGRGTAAPDPPPAPGAGMTPAAAGGAAPGGGAEWAGRVAGRAGFC